MSDEPRKTLKLSGVMREIAIDAAGECIVPESGPESGQDIPPINTTSVLLMDLAEVEVNINAFRTWLDAQPDTIHNYTLGTSFAYNGWITFTVSRDVVTNLLPPDEIVLGLCNAIGGQWRARLQYGQEGIVLWGHISCATVCILTRWTGRADVPRVPFIKVPDPVWPVRDGAVEDGS